MAEKIGEILLKRNVVTSDLLEKLGGQAKKYKDAELFKGKGCEDCSDTGYKGRIALYEVMPMTESLKELVLQGASAIKIKKESISLGLESLRQSGIAKMLHGVTTL